MFQSINQNIFNLTIDTPSPFFAKGLFIAFMKQPKKYRVHFNRSSQTLPLKSVIDSFLKTSNMEAKFGHEQIKQSWEEIMGAPIARRTNKLFVKNRKLFIELNSAPLKNELIISKSKVIARIHEFPGGKSIEDLVFL